MGMGVKKSLRPGSHGNEHVNPNDHLFHGGIKFMQDT
jgi:hypothetical protein